MIVASRLTSLQPLPATSAATCRSNSRLSASLYAGSLEGNCPPMSPRPAAVPQQTPVVRDRHAAQHQWAALDEPVDVVAGSYADGSTSAMPRDARTASASARSWGVVTFRLP